MYALVENNQIKQIGLPTSGVLKNGRTISGYNLLDDATLRAEGWLPIQGEPPEHNPQTQELEVAYTIEADKVIAIYTIIQITQPLTLEELAENVNAALLAVMELSLE